MSAQAFYDGRASKRKQPIVNPPTLSNPGHSGPTTFFLKSESEMEKSMQSRGRRTSRDSKDTSPEQGNSSSISSSIADSSFGVQSLEDTISESLYSDRTSTLSRAESNDAAQGAQEVLDGPDPFRMNSRKRRAGNPVHPSIRSAGNRIISSEQSSAQPSSVASPASFRSAGSPFRSHLRRASYSSISLGQPITPLRASPFPESALPGTPRSGSLTSFRLSDEERSVTSETHSHAVQSSSDGEEDEVSLDLTGEEHEQSRPQLVMPSISLPTRRPFTERGRTLGRLKVMVVGPAGCGKSTFISSLARVSKDIVHTDPSAHRDVGLSTLTDQYEYQESFKTFSETHASTKPYPSWWRGTGNDMPNWRRKSFGDTMLERNLCFIDTPSTDGGKTVPLILQELDQLLQQNARYETMNDTQLLDLFSGEGGTYVNVVLYLFSPSTEPMSESERRTLLQLCGRAVLVPVISHADTIAPADLATFRERLSDDLQPVKDAYSRIFDMTLPFTSIPAISCAAADDSEEVDASLLMSPDYHPPLRESDLSTLINTLLNPNTLTRLRHESARRFIYWRKMYLHEMAPPPNPSSPSHRSLSPMSPIPQPTSSSAEPSSQALARLDSLNKPSPSQQPFNQVRLAKWAEDLQRSLAKDRSRYTHFPHILHPPFSPDSVPCFTNNDKTLSRPARGRLGGDLAVIDPSDPLGILSAVQSLHRRGWFALQVSAGVAMVWWIVRSWAEWTGWGGHDYGVVEAVAVQAPGREGWGWW